MRRRLVDALGLPRQDLVHRGLVERCGVCEQPGVLLVPEPANGGEVGERPALRPVVVIVVAMQNSRQLQPTLTMSKSVANADPKSVASERRSSSSDSFAVWSRMPSSTRTWYRTSSGGTPPVRSLASGCCAGCARAPRDRAPPTAAARTCRTGRGSPSSCAADLGDERRRIGLVVTVDRVLGRTGRSLQHPRVVPRAFGLRHVDPLLR